MTWLIGLLAGTVSGVVAALCGVGGGIILVPLFGIFLGLDQRTAVATSLAIIVPTSLAATLKNHGNQFIHWPVVPWATAGAVAAALLAAEALKTLSNQTLSRIFAIVLIAIGVHMLFRR